MQTVPLVLATIEPLVALATSIRTVLLAKPAITANGAIISLLANNKKLQLPQMAQHAKLPLQTHAIPTAKFMEMIAAVDATISMAVLGVQVRKFVWMNDTQLVLPLLTLAILALITYTVILVWTIQRVCGVDRTKLANLRKKQVLALCLL